MKPWAHPGAINTDKAPAYRPAITELKAEGKCPPDTVHRQVKYLNNIIEADHGKLKLLINPVRGFKSMKTAYAAIKGFELVRMFKKGQLDIWKLGQGLPGEIWLKGNSVSTGHNQSDHTHSFLVCPFFATEPLFA
jgi:transposase, IS6 family